MVVGGAGRWGGDVREPRSDSVTHVCAGSAYRGASLIRNSAPLGPYSRVMPRILEGS